MKTVHNPNCMREQSWLMLFSLINPDWSSQLLVLIHFWPLRWSPFQRSWMMINPLWLLNDSPSALGGSGSSSVPSSDPVKPKTKMTNSEKHQRREDLRLTRMMMIIFCCFLVCFLPLMVVNVADDEVIGDYPFFCFQNYAQASFFVS